MYATLSDEALANLDEAAIEAFITPQEREALATKHWYFDVDVPVVVSLLREKGQAVVPFWLEESGFVKTELEVINSEGWRYEVWQKSFDAGRVELGINGFDKHRPHYLLSVGPQKEGTKVNITGLHPSKFSMEVTQAGSMCYHDWSDIVLKDVPPSLQGQVLLTTIRGRARAAHLIGAFRRTDYPSSTTPDQVMLTWSEDPKTTQSIQWRTHTDVPDGVVRWRERDASVSGTVSASVTRIQDRMLVNDRYVHRYTAVLRGLKPDTAYVYSVGSPSATTWSEEAEFKTAPAGKGPLTFFVTGDTHNKEVWGDMMTAALARHPEAAFYVIAGDMVGTGQYRNDWDTFFHHPRQVINRIPLMPSLGNHDSIDGLGPGVFLSLFALPEDGPESLEPERAYAFEYGNVLMINLDCTARIAPQDAWLEEVLKNSKATWKFASYHFPNYDPHYKDEYQSITDHWSALFDKYHVDMVFQGHVHRYMRTAPIKDGKIMDSPADGTIYLVSIALPDQNGHMPKADYIEKAITGVGLYQTIQIDGDRMVLEARDATGKIHDAITILK
ncbi:MAG: fibronectin type III domain-containing protein, partial [Candidatus Hydrogenedentes bacterium]|nr:fibronectin type III domain-containing protein [Candidatus Hydrogenedentota bacterium]